MIDLHGPLSAVVGAWRERVGHRKPGVERDVMTVEEAEAEWGRVEARGGAPRRADEARGGGDKGDAAVRA